MTIPEKQAADAAADTYTRADVEAMIAAQARRAQATQAAWDEKLAKLEALVEQRGAELAMGPQGVVGSDEYKGIQKRLAETEGRLKAADEARRKTADLAMRQQLAELLVSAAGVDQKYTRQAVGHLVDVERRVRCGADGTPVFVDGIGELDLATGVKSWADSEEAKLYKPALGVRGSGGAPVGGARPLAQGTQPPTKAELGRALAEALGGSAVDLG